MLIIISLILLIIVSIIMNNLEYYEKIPYDECIEKKHSQKKCSKKITSLYGNTSCVCENGNIGVLKHGFRTKCNCNLYNN